MRSTTASSLSSGLQGNDSQTSSPHLKAPSGSGSQSRSSSMRRRAETDDSEKAGRVWAREVDQAWDACILTLDGGGIRGYSSLLILKALMHEVWEWERRLDAEDERDATAVRGPSRGRSPLHHELGNEPEAVEERRGVQLQDPKPEQEHTRPIQNIVQHDSLTANVSAKKAISEEELLPCHYFDFMYGTSTGGLIATMLGRLRMTVSECLEIYRKVGEDLFGRRKSSIPLMTKYYHEPLEKAVQDIVGSRCHEHENCDGTTDLHPWDADRLSELLQREMPFDIDQPRVCQSCCLTATHDEQITDAYLLRTYPHYYSQSCPNWITRYNEGADEIEIWKATRATSAAPFYFEMIDHEVDGQIKSFKDGGIRENNPSGAAISEFHSLYEGKAEEPGILLSVGTGRPDTKNDGFAQAWSSPLGKIPMVSKFLEKRAVIANVLIKYTEGERQHGSMREHARGEHRWYKRLNVSDGLQTLALDAWVKGDWNGLSNVPGGSTLTHMENVTTAYLEREFSPLIDTYAPPKIMLEQAAEKLVRQRRAREREGGERWDTFAGKHLYRTAAKSTGANGHLTVQTTFGK